MHSDRDDDDAASVEMSFDELARVLRADRSVPRSARRAALSDARRFCEVAASAGSELGAVRFRALRCTCCGVLEITGGFSPGVRRRVH